MALFAARVPVRVTLALMWPLIGVTAACAGPSGSTSAGFVGEHAAGADVSAGAYAEAWRRNVAAQQGNGAAAGVQDHDAGYVPPMPGSFYYPSPAAPRGAYADNDAGYYYPPRLAGAADTFRFLGYWDN